MYSFTTFRQAYHVRDLEVPERDGVVGQEALHSAAAVLDREAPPVGLVGGGLRGVVLAVQQARDLGPGALLGGDPQVGRARVEDDREHLQALTRSSCAVNKSETLVHVDRVGEKLTKLPEEVSQFRCRRSTERSGSLEAGRRRLR